MPVDRSIASTIQRFREEIREKVVYANDLSEGSGSPALASLGVSPVWQLHTNSNRDVYGDVKIPRDRVPGTPIDVKIVFAVSQGGGEGHVLLNFEYLIVSEGVNLTAARQPTGLLVSCPAASHQTTTNPIRIASSRLDGLTPSADIQFRVQREGANALDTHGGNVWLIKVVFEYTAYV